MVVIQPERRQGCMSDLLGYTHRQVFCRLKTDSSIKDKAACADNYEVAKAQQ